MHTTHLKKIRIANILMALFVLAFIGNQFVEITFIMRLLEAVLLVALLVACVIYQRGVRRDDADEGKIEGLEHQLRKTQWKLAVTKEQVDVLDQRKREFVAVVSHQLRAPITAIKGYSSMITEESYGKVPARMTGPVNKIFLSSKRAAELVTNFLDMAKIEEGTLLYNFTSVDVGILLTDLVGEYSNIAKKRGLTLKLRFTGKELLISTADESKLRQILSNLIDNALKYTPTGGVTVTAELDHERGVVRITIKDTGMGLSQDDVQNLFHKFVRGARGQKEFTEGSGLGLYVAKKMLESHKGEKLWVDSEGIGKGSTFVLELLAEEMSSS